MGLDKIRIRNMDQGQNDIQKIEEIERMKLDPDLREMVMKAKNNLRIEKISLERQNEYDKMINDLNSSTKKSIDSMSLSDVNGGYLNYSGNSISQEENNGLLSSSYSDEKREQMRENIKEIMQEADDLLIMLQEKIDELDVSTTLEDSQTIKHR